METRKLYYEDSHRRSFFATVLSCEKQTRGWQILLDQTCFYPEGGGQACDLGTLGDANVLDVQEIGDQVCHLCDRPLPEGSRVEGVIQWERRFDMMQQHTGEHLLSGLIHSRFGHQNSGFHMGTQVMEVDFDGPIPAQALWELEQQVNALVWANIPVRCYYPTQEELPQVQYRTKRQLPWPVRIVEIPGGDSCACCGIHVKNTGEIGLIKILSCVKFHKGVRLEMVCGGRAYSYMKQIFEQNRQISQLLSAQMTQTAPAVEKLAEAAAAEKYRSAALEKKVLDGIARSYRGSRNAVHFEEALSGGAVRELAVAIARQVSGVGAVFSGSDDQGYQLCIASESVDVRQLAAPMVQALGGRGGGKQNVFQGWVKASRQQIQAYLQKAME